MTIREPAPIGATDPAVAALIAAVPALAAALVKPVPVEVWSEEISTLYAPGLKARSTRLRMRQAMREAVALGIRTTAELTPALLARFASASIASGRRAETTDGLLRALRAACGVAVRRGWLGRDPFGDHAPWVLDPDDRRRRHHPAADVAKVLEHLARLAVDWEGARLHAFAAVLAYAGLRKMEASRLRVEDVDLDRGFLFIERRSGLKTRASAAPVPIPDALREVLAAWIPRCGSEWLFPGVTRSGPWTGGSSGRRAGDRLKAAGEAVGVRGLTPQSLRHSLGTHLTTRHGLTDTQARLVLRHATGRTTREHYIHPDLVNLRALVAGFSYAPGAAQAAAAGGGPPPPPSSAGRPAPPRSETTQRRRPSRISRSTTADLLVRSLAAWTTSVVHALPLRRIDALTGLCSGASAPRRRLGLGDSGIGRLAPARRGGPEPPGRRSPADRRIGGSAAPRPASGLIGSWRVGA